MDQAQNLPLDPPAVLAPPPVLAPQQQRVGQAVDRFESDGSPPIQPDLLNAPATVDPTMILSDDERQWTLQIKEAFQNASHFGNGVQVSDFFFAQHALVSHGDVDEALMRIEGMHRFYQEYEIDHSPEQALYYVREFMQQQPGYILHLDVSPITQQAWLVTDSAAFQVQQALASDERWKICVCGTYYIVHYCQGTTLTSIRQGILCEIECDSVGWHNFNSEFVTRLFGELFSYIPSKYQMMRAYNTTVVANLLFSLAKPFMSENQKSSIKLGCQVVSNSPGSDSGTRRLSEFYLQPNTKVATQRIIQRIDELLRIRTHNEETFRI